MKTYFHQALKNADLQSDLSGAVTATRLYDAWGNVVSSTGSWASPFGNAGRFGYQEDPDSGLKLLGHRYYDSSTGRFLTRDPMSSGKNWYVYCGNRPQLRVDPTGYEWHDPAQIIVSGEFEGTVVAFGDFSWQKGDGWRDCVVPPGFMTDPRMDVDLVIVIMPDGSYKVYFLLGKGIRGDGKEEPSQYYVDKDGNIVALNGSRSALEVHPFGFDWFALWWAWLDEAARTGMPAGYQPREAPSEPCIYHPNGYRPKDWQDLFPGWNKTAHGGPITRQ